MYIWDLRRKLFPYFDRSVTVFREGKKKAVDTQKLSK